MELKNFGNVPLAILSSSMSALLLLTREQGAITSCFLLLLSLCKPTLGHNPNQRKQVQRKDLWEIKFPDLFNFAGVEAGAYKSLQDF